MRQRKTRNGAGNITNDLPNTRICPECYGMDLNCSKCYGTGEIENETIKPI